MELAGHDQERQAVTALLRRWTGGNAEALNELMPIVYEHLRTLAGSALASERTGHTLSATSLVHEAYLRLVDSEISWANRGHFFSLAARLMRRILVDHARAARRAKRGGGMLRVTLGDAAALRSGTSDDVAAIDEALTALERFDERKAKLIELLYFGGATQPDAAQILGVSESTVARELRLARAWLRQVLEKGHGSGASHNSRHP